MRQPEKQRGKSGATRKKARHRFTLVRAEPLLIVISAKAARDDAYQELAWEVLEALAAHGAQVEALAPDATRALLRSERFGDLIVERATDRPLLVVMRPEEVLTYTPADCVVEKTVRLEAPSTGGAR